MQEIRLAEITATSQTHSGQRLLLQPTYDHDCVPTKVDGEVIEVACKYNFKVRSSDVEVAEASMTYRVVYKLLGDDPTETSDIEHFARANGAYHTWPFVRETIHALTAKMGFPPYTLPVLSFMPRPTPTVSSTPVSQPEATVAPEKSPSV